MEKLLEIPEIDIVCVCNESGLHGETISRIVKAGKNILCEKPLETTVDKINKIERVLESSHIKLGCVFQNRENPEYIKLKNYLDSGALGKFYYVNQLLIGIVHQNTMRIHGGELLVWTEELH